MDVLKDFLFPKIDFKRDNPHYSRQNLIPLW